MKHIVSIEPTQLDAKPSLPKGGTYWRLQCATPPDWYRSLPHDSVLRLSYIDHIYRAIRMLDGVSMVSSIAGGEENVLKFSFATAPSDELPREIVEAVDDILDRELYSKTPPVTGNGNDI